MKFSFVISKGSKIRRGTMDAVDSEQAYAALESKGYHVERLEPLEREVSRALSPLGLFSIALCGLGVLGCFWSAFQTSVPLTAARGREVVVLEVKGRLEGDLSAVDKISVLFPELPARLEGSWTDVGEPDGSYSLRRELSIAGRPPGYFQIVVTGSDGQPVAQGTRLPYREGKGDAGSLPLESSEG